MKALVPTGRLLALAAGGLIVGATEIAGVLMLFLLGLSLASGGTPPSSDVSAPVLAVADGLGVQPILALAAGLVVATLARGVVTLTYERRLGALHSAIVLGATNQLFAGYFRMDYSRFVDRNSSDRALHLTTELDRAALAAVAWIRTVALGLVLVVMTALLVAIDWRAAALGGAAALAIGSAVIPLVRWTSTLAARRRSAQAHLAVDVSEPLRAYRDLAISGLWPRFHRHVEASQKEFIGVQRRLAVVQSATPHILEVGVAVVVLGAVALAIALGNGPSAATPVLILLVAGAYRFLPTLQRLLYSLGTFRVNQPSLAGTLAELEEVRRSARRPVPVSVADPDHLLVLRGVRFAHRGQADLLVGIDLEVRRGERIGIVGPSGAGKTTLVDLVLGLLHPAAGHIEKGHGRDGRHLRVAYLPQNPAFAQGTVVDNLALAHEDQVDEAEAQRLLRLVGLGDLPLSFQLGEAGSGLSGGQRQRLGLARALHSDPDLLVLDEPTGALDADTESEVVDALARVRGPTMLVVTHRRAPLALCDRVYLLDEGVLVPVASPAAMLDVAAPPAQVAVPEPAP